MLQSSDTVTTIQRNRLGETKQSGSQSEQTASGEDLARLFKYYRQVKDPASNFTVPAINRISAKKFYNLHKRAFDMTAAFFAAHGIDAKPYIRFFVCELGKSGSDVNELLFSKTSVSSYATKLQAVEKKKKIWAWFQKSVSNIVDMCIRNDYMSGKDCVLSLIRSKRIAQEFLTGRISKYFFAAMPNFRNIIPRLDHFAKAEFAELYDKFDIYNTEINDVFLTYRNRTVNPFSIVDAELIKRRSARSERQREELFDPSL